MTRTSLKICREWEQSDERQGWQGVNCISENTTQGQQANYPSMLRPKIIPLETQIDRSDKKGSELTPNEEVIQAKMRRREGPRRVRGQNDSLPCEPRRELRHGWRTWH